MLANIKIKNMNIFELKDFYLRIDQLIRLKATGSPKELSNKLGISESHLYRIIRKMKEDAHCPIVFSKIENSYIYTNNGRLVVEFNFHIIEKESLNKIRGGEKNHFPLYSLSEKESGVNYFCTDNFIYKLKFYSE
jgi:AraC-like DNA-binding protein